MSQSKSSTVAATTAILAIAASAALAVVPPAQAAEGSGIIRGTVLETGHTVAPGIDVSLYQSSGEFVSATVTNSQAGAYQFPDLKAGSYVLWFENQNEAVSEWYDNQPDKPQAVPITLADGAVFVADAYLTQVSENLVRPTVSGTATVGSTLTAARGTWFPTQSVEFRYQWLRDSMPIEGATQATYTLREVDSGSPMSVEIIAVHQGATESAESAQTAVVTGGTPPASSISSTSAPTITGSTTVGALLGATSGGWSPSDVTVTLEWLRGATVVASGASYTTTAADVGATLRVRSTATKTGWTSATAESAPFGPVVAAPPVAPPVTPPADPVAAPTNAGAPTLTGPGQVGSTLTASTGTWTGAPIGYAYQWTRNGAPIAGATGAALALTGPDAGTAVGVVVTATNPGGSTAAASATSAVAKATSTVAAKVKAPKKGRLTVQATVASAGTGTGKVTITVKVAGRSVTKSYKVRGGTAKATISGLRKGRATVTISYSGDTSTAPSQLVKKATLR